MRWHELSTPIGGLGVAVNTGAICRVEFGGVPPAARGSVVTRRPAVPGEPVAAGEPAGSPARGATRESVGLAPSPDDAALAEAAEQLDRYFSGALTDFDLPLSVTSGSDFERAVWRAIAAIPYAQMRTYGQIAADVGDPGSARAVGVACNRNPLPIVVPCHRVVGAGGKLVGFGGGLPRKRFLLELEARVRIEREFLL